MEIKISNAILHILNGTGGCSILSRNELDIDSETCEEFVSKHVKKLLNNPSAKEACFNPSSKLLGLVNSLKNGERFFKDVSIDICTQLSEIMEEHTVIPPGDLLIVRFAVKYDEYLAILKLNYKECFTHAVEGDDDDTGTQIVKYSAVLPFDGGKVEEACLIPYDPMIIRLIEKPYDIGGEMKNYFSEMFLDCDAAISKKEAVQAINQITEEITERYYGDDITMPAQIKTALIEEAEEEEGVVSIESVAKRVFSDNEDARMEYIELAREAGMKSDLVLGEKFSKQNFGFQKIKAENGVELKIPSELSADPDFVEFIKNSDGTTSVLLKRLGKLEAKS